MRLVSLIVCLFLFFFGASSAYAQGKGTLVQERASSVHVDLSVDNSVAYYSAYLIFNYASGEYVHAATRGRGTHFIASADELIPPLDRTSPAVLAKEAELRKSRQAMELTGRKMIWVEVAQNTLCYLIARKTVLPPKGSESAPILLYKVRLLSGKYKGKIGWTIGYGPFKSQGQ